MAWWNREVIPRREIQVGVTPRVVDALPESWGDGRFADQARSFVELEAIDTGCELDVFRLCGADPEQLAPLDSTPYATVSVGDTVVVVEWPLPLPAFLCLRVVARCTSGPGPVSVSVRCLQTLRVEG